LQLAEVISRANRLFCESTPSTHYATLAAGLATEQGVDLCNAGHCSPLLLRRGGTDRIEATGLPLGLFCDCQHTVRHIPFAPGDSLVLYTDGITEAQDPAGNQYDEERLIRSLHSHAMRDPLGMVEGLLGDVARFCDTQPRQDDITLLVVHRRG
jgi:sigma-B regulation protein RsbU (phosphoserine phosphatase)